MSAEQAETHATDWCAAHGPRPCACWADGEPEVWDDCECGWSSGHRDLCCCGSWAALDAGEADEPDDCDCGTCTAIRLDRLARLVERPMVTLRPSPEYL